MHNLYVEKGRHALVGLNLKVKGLRTYLDMEPITKNFLKKYYSTSIRNLKEAEFITLTYGSMSLTEYELKFEELSHYPPSIVDTEKKRWDILNRCSRDDLRQTVVVLELGTYHEVLTKTHLVDFRGHFSKENKQ